MSGEIIRSFLFISGSPDLNSIFESRSGGIYKNQVQQNKKNFIV